MIQLRNFYPQEITPIAPYDTPDAVENLCNAYEQAIANEKIGSD